MRVLLAVDGSSWSREAVRTVGLGTWPPGTEVRVVIVDARLDDSTLVRGWRAGDSAYDELVRRQRAEAQEDLDAAAASLHQLAPHLGVTASLLEGSPKEEIVNEARRWGADLIVVGSQGRGAIKSLFLGSVSLAVVLNAPCSVLVVRTPQASAGGGESAP